MTGIRLRGGPAANKPSPWLRFVFQKMREDGFDPRRKWFVDLGAGNGRNAAWLWDQGLNGVAVDPAPGGADVACWDGQSHLRQVQAHSCDIILLQYVLMFVPPARRMPIAHCINRLARFNCVLLLEAYAAKNQHYKPAMLYDFVRQLNRSCRSEGEWVPCATEGNDHLAFQFRAA